MAELEGKEAGDEELSSSVNLTVLEESNSVHDSGIELIEINQEYEYVDEIGKNHACMQDSICSPTASKKCTANGQ